jgi:hypothetical protein
MSQLMLNGCWRDMIWLDANVDILYAKKIDLNNPEWVLSI